MDDWDYAILCPPDTVEQVEGYGLQPKDWQIGNLLHGCCENTWYLAKIRGQEYAIGIAYHA